MPALFFPNLTALRLALASGLVPIALARAPAAAGFDARGQLWLELPELPPRDSLAALARVGVKAQGAAGVPTEPVRCWAELLPLVRSTEPPTGPVLFIVPERSLAKLVARLRRSSESLVGVCLRDATDEPHGWVTAINPSPTLLSEASEPGAPIAAFVEQAPNI